MKKLLSVLLMSLLFIPVASMAKNRLPADLNGVKLSPVQTEYLSSEGKIEVSFSVTVPANYFERRVTFVLMPSIELIDGELIKLPYQGVQGTSVVDTNYPVVDWSKEQVISYTTKVPVNAALLHSVLHIDVYLYNCLSKAERVERIYSGPLNLAALPIAPMIIPANVVVGDVLGEAKPEGRITFRVNSHAVTREGTNNPSFNKMNDMLKFLMQDPAFTITEVNIVGNASPEGTDRINKPLAANRARAAVAHMKQNLRTLGYNKTLTDDQYKINDSPDFWEEFFQFMSESNHPRKNEIIAQFLNYRTDPDESERSVRTLINNDQTIREIIFPDLRYSAIRVSFDRSSMNQDLLAEAARLYPSILTPNEFAKAAEAEPSLERKVEMYKAAIALYPTSWELYANLGNAYLKLNDYKAASDALDNAMKLSPDNPKIKAQMAYTHIIAGNHNQANQILSGISGPEADYYRGIILLEQGRHEQAIPLLRAMPDVNLAIAQLNAKQTREAYQTLQRLEQENVYTAFYTGVALRRLNRAEEAEQFFNKAAQLNRGELDGRTAVDYHAFIR
ncbi:MAG: tetratricopeptide repeat protein [Bacteroidales bacterium]|nr:tetratricopeptide repeat protein [Bacteroidales bacterium]MCL2738434.1 tetratricopeptide repeat protein [Bacteroidales bacterium]